MSIFALTVDTLTVVSPVLRPAVTVVPPDNDGNVEATLGDMAGDVKAAERGVRADDHDLACGEVGRGGIHHDAMPIRGQGEQKGVRPGDRFRRTGGRAGLTFELAGRR